jgi:multimeric flavodoxin WrbA
VIIYGTHLLNRREVRRMQILGIVCSPRRNGNTEVLVKETLETARGLGADTEMTGVIGKTINPCDACATCYTTGKCRIDDDMQAIYTRMLRADAIVLGAPVYYWDICAQAKAIIDRTYVFRRRRELRNKVGGAVIVAGQAGASVSFNNVMGFFNIQKMMLAKSIGPRSEQELPDDRVGGVIAYAFDLGAVRENQRAMAQARALGKSIVETIELLGRGIDV